MNLEVGDLFKSTMYGICVLTEKYPENTIIYDSVVLGTFCRLSFGSRVYKLHDDTKVYPVTDKDIEEFLLNEMCGFDLDNDSAITIYENEFGGIAIADKTEAVFLTKEAALKLKEILNRELI